MHADRHANWKVATGLFGIKNLKREPKIQLEIKMVYNNNKESEQKKKFQKL